MKAVIIAAGRGNRMGELTRTRPKCMLPVHGKPILTWMLERFAAAGIDDVTVVRGYRAEAIAFPGLTYAHNARWAETNILHSLMNARAVLESGEPVIATYADITFEQHVLDALLAAKGDLVILGDSAWEAAYAGRENHPVEDAEFAFAEADGTLRLIGKDLFGEAEDAWDRGEFLGMWRMSPAGCAAFLRHFDRVDAELDDEAPFQRAAHWRQAYVCDLFTDMLARGESIQTCWVPGDWNEVDTPEDYLRAGGTIHD